MPHKFLILLSSCTLLLTSADCGQSAEPDLISGRSADHADNEARISALEQEIEWLKRRPVPNVLANPKQQRACSTSRNGGLFFGTEVYFLRPYLSGARSSNTASGGKWIDPSYGTGVRYVLGWQNDDGLGLKARYFSMNHGADLAGVFGGGSVGVGLEAVDAEVTLQDQHGRWDTLVSGGIRYGELTITGDGVVIFPGQLSFEGIGPTVAFEARRPLGNSRFTIFGSLRGSFLLGEIRNGQPTTGLARGSVEDEVTNVFENQLGISWSLAAGRKCDVEIRAAWDTQVWLNDTIADDVYGIGTNVTLSGPVLAVELKY